MPRKGANERPAHPVSWLARPSTSQNQGQLWGQQLDLIGFSLQSIEQTSINPQKMLSRRALPLLRMWKLRGAAGSGREGRGGKKSTGLRAPDLVLRRESSCWKRMNLQNWGKGGGRGGVPQGFYCYIPEAAAKWDRAGVLSMALCTPSPAPEKEFKSLDFGSKPLL